MNLLHKRIILIIVGIGLCGIGGYVTNQALDSIPQDLSYAQTLNKLALTNYTFGIIMLSIGIVLIGMGAMWKRIFPKRKP